MRLATRATPCSPSRSMCPLRVPFPFVPSQLVSSWCICNILVISLHLPASLFANLAGRCHRRLPTCCLRPAVDLARFSICTPTVAVMLRLHAASIKPSFTRAHGDDVSMSPRTFPTKRWHLRGLSPGWGPAAQGMECRLEACIELEASQTIVRKAAEEGGQGDGGRGSHTGVRMRHAVFRRANRSLSMPDALQVDTGTTSL